MRTTISLDDEVLRRAKVMAAETGMTLSELVEQALAAELERSAATGRSAPPFLPVSSASGGLRPGARLEPKHELWQLLEESEPDDRLRR